MVGRKKELLELNRLYHSKKAELVAIYGRRRVGKTYLVDEALKDRITFRHAGLSPAEHEKKGLLRKQLEGFYYSLLRAGMTGAKRPGSWMEAFFMLETFLDQQDERNRQVVFFDEFPWMDTQRAGFMTAFENFWNGWACYHNNLMVIVCGSASSWILDKLINNHGGLYNRVTYEIKLSPFTLNECELFLEEKGILLSRYDIVQSYMAVGGIPYYLGYFEPGYSLAQNLDHVYFVRGAKLHREFDRLFDSVFEKPELMKSIVRKLFTRNMGFSRGELISALGMTEGETMSKCLNALVSSEFVVRYTPFGQKEKSHYYKLVDPFCLFYLYFVEGSGSAEEDYWTQRIETQEVKTWRGLAFENVCFNHIRQIKSALGISGVSTTHSAWTKKPDDTEGLQIDLLIARKDNIVNMCEIKYSNDVFHVNSSYHRTLLRRSAILSEHVAPIVAIHNTLITTYGLKLGKNSGVFTNVVTMNDLFQPT